MAKVREVGQRSKSGFKEAILHNLWVISKQAAQTFDNIYRINTDRFADQIAECFTLLTTKLDTEEVRSLSDSMWHAYATLWQAANALLAAYQGVRIGHPIEAAVVARHGLELQALAIKLFLEPATLSVFLNGRLDARACISSGKRLFPDFGKHYGLLSELAHPSLEHVGSYIHRDSDGTIKLLIGAGHAAETPSLVRGMLTKGVVLWLEHHSEQLHATIERVSFDSIVSPQYWKRQKASIIWSPSEAVQLRAEERMSKLSEMFERTDKATQE